jgi:NADH-quinone oxidoreductase subunit L
MTLFPANDFTLIAFILGFPLLGAFVNGVWGRKLGKDAVRIMALTATGLSFVASLVAFFALTQHVEANKHEHVKLAWTAWQWMHTSGSSGANIPIDLRFSIDALSGVMMLVVTGVGFLIHLYSTSYMDKDPAYWRFFAYMNLFIFAMLVLILGDNLPVLFIGWEGVGLCSYLLIGFWYTKLPNAAAGKKAFIANRIGDFGIICAMFLFAHYCGALDWNGISNGSMNLVGGPDEIHVWPLGGGHYQGFLSALQPNDPFTISAATAVGLALLLGATGKSAQIPLYVWLPDAMAGPTPVSALIHAATMVTAGVYLVCRLSFVFVLSPFVMMTIAIIGAATALFAATIALVQNDIKKVLAYSTISQLGFMFLGVGVGAFTAAFFHVFTHAFFKACLFLGAGSVIHAMHGRIHDDDKAQDMRFMGGLRKYMPLTFWTFAAATAAIIGFPLTSGFFSKDEILFKAFVNQAVTPPEAVARLMPSALEHVRRLHAHDKQALSSDQLEGLAKASIFQAPHWLGGVLYGVGVVAAALTAFYMCRLFFRIFFGEFKGWTVGRPSVIAREEIEEPHDDLAVDDDDEHAAAHHEDLTTAGYPPHESPWQMTVPLILLAAFAVFAGVLNPGFHLSWQPMDRWLEPVFAAASESGIKEIAGGGQMTWVLALGGVSAFLAGTLVAYWMYVAEKGRPAERLAAAFPRVYHLVLDKWRVDEFYDATVIAAVDSLAETSVSLDKYVIDGVLAKATSFLVSALGTILRAFQNGVVHVYAAMMVVGLVVIGWFFAVPHASAAIVQRDGDHLVLEAGPGMGYSFRWDKDGDGKPETADFTGGPRLDLTVDPSRRLAALSNPAGTGSSTLTVDNTSDLKPGMRVRVVAPSSDPKDAHDYDIVSVNATSGTSGTVTLARTHFSQLLDAYPVGSEIYLGPAKVGIEEKNAFGFATSRTVWVERRPATQEVGQN